MTITAEDLLLKIQANHAAPEWACFSEVPNGTGGHSRRRADALAMSLWPSRGLILRGFEIKVNRTDWRKELKNPRKAEEIGKFCDEWWIVAPEGVIRDPEKELPPAWGLMMPNKNGTLCVKHKAQRLDPVQITRPFLAAILRAADNEKADHNIGWIRRSEIAEQIAEAEQRGKRQIPRETWRIRSDLDKLKKRMTAFRDSCGIDLLGEGTHDWRINATHIGDALRIGLAILGESHEWERLLNTASTVANQATDFKRRLMEAHHSLEKIDKEYREG